MNGKILPPTGQFSPAWTDFFILLGTILLVTLAILVWALVFRKGGRRYQHHHHHHHAGSREESEKSAGGIKELVQRHQHHRRREHRLVNPTLAETGGLPPIRGEETPPPSQP
jgi:ABC-type transport system involved in cytochrome bd biosynthesis fused ATPase/permease subunit